MENSLLPKLFDTQKTLGFLELEVMRIIWRKRKCTVRDVVEDLKKEKLLAYTTIMTVMDNLYKKGFVTRVKVKRSYHYTPSAPENFFIRLSISRLLQGLMFEYGKITVFSSLISAQVNLSLHKLNPIFAFYKTPILTGFLTSLVLSLFAVSFWDLLQNLVFFGSADYLKLAFSEPKIIFDHSNLILGAFFESLPTVSLLTNLILLIFVILIVRKITKLLNFKFPMFFRMEGLA